MRVKIIIPTGKLPFQRRRCIMRALNVPRMRPYLMCILSTWAVLNLFCLTHSARTHRSRRTVEFASLSRVSQQVHVTANANQSVRTYAAIMFHSDVKAFESPLENIEPLLSPLWAVRLFIPIDGDTVQEEFERSKVYLSRLRVSRRLLAKGVEVAVHPHRLKDLVIGLPRNAHGVAGSGPILANNFALARETYETIPEEHIVLFQEDVAFCVKAQHRSLESFMHHAWLGAPWLVYKTHRSQDGGRWVNSLYGNGGLSVRSKSFVLSCIDSEGYLGDLEKSRVGKGMPEDMFFSRCFFENFSARVDVDDAIAFSAEEIIIEGQSTLAVHDPCRTVGGVAAIGCGSDTHRRVTRDLIKRCPEAKMIISRCVSHCNYGA